MVNDAVRLGVPVRVVVFVLEVVRAEEEVTVGVSVELKEIEDEGDCVPVAVVVAVTAAVDDPVPVCVEL